MVECVMHAQPAGPLRMKQQRCEQQNNGLPFGWATTVAKTDDMSAVVQQG